jgi:OOP family OmpA-OmpF porin
MKKGILLLAMASGLSLLASHGASAENRAGAFTLTPGVAYDFFAAKRQLNNTWLLPTVGLAYNFDERWAVEGMYSTFGTSQKGTGPHPSVRGGLYTMGGLYRFARYSMLEPYVSFGVGVNHINPNGNDAYNEANINAGLGTQVFFDESIALRGEVRDIYTMSGGKNDVTIGMGVSFLFGGHPDKPAAPYKDEPPVASNKMGK